MRDLSGKRSTSARELGDNGPRGAGAEKAAGLTGAGGGGAKPRAEGTRADASAGARTPRPHRPCDELLVYPRGKGSHHGFKEAGREGQISLPKDDLGHVENGRVGGKSG